MTYDGKIEEKVYDFNRKSVSITGTMLEDIKTSIKISNERLTDRICDLFREQGVLFNQSVVEDLILGELNSDLKRAVEHKVNSVSEYMRDVTKTFKEKASTTNKDDLEKEIINVLNEFKNLKDGMVDFEEIITFISTSISRKHMLNNYEEAKHEFNKIMNRERVNLEDLFHDSFNQMIEENIATFERTGKDLEQSTIDGEVSNKDEQIREATTSNNTNSVTDFDDIVLIPPSAFSQYGIDPNSPSAQEEYEEAVKAEVEVETPNERDSLINLKSSVIEKNTEQEENIEEGYIVEEKPKVKVLEFNNKYDAKDGFVNPLILSVISLTTIVVATLVSLIIF